MSLTVAVEPPPFKLAKANRTRLCPTLRATWLLAAGVPLGVLLIAIDPTLWTLPAAYGLVILAVIGADAMLLCPRRAIDVSVTAPARLPVAETGEAQIALRMQAKQSSRLDLLLEQSGPLAPPVGTSTLVRRGRLALAIPLSPLRRGRASLDALWLRWRGPLGLMERRWRLVVQRRIDIVPNVRLLDGAALAVLMEPARAGTKVQRDRGEGSEFETLREHVPGLDNRTIDWKRSARHTKLLSKVFRAERNHNILLAFDTGHLMNEPIEGKTRLDRSIESALQLGSAAVTSGDLVGLFAFDARLRAYLAPAAGLPSLARLQHAVARLAYTTEETNFTLALAELAQRVKRRTLVIVFTEFVDMIAADLLIEAVQRLANRHVVLFVTLQDPQMAALLDTAPSGFMPLARTVIAADLLRERAIVLERLARRGVHVLDIEARNLTTGLLNRYLALKQRGVL
jgi:uncharacterized protein (DUF58 family)